MAIGILIGSFTHVLDLGDKTEWNQKETDSYQDRMRPDQREMSPPDQDEWDEEGSVKGKAGPSSGVGDGDYKFNK
ncbi:MAG TPA: hypothetical protein VGI33_15950 [Paenibacillus sp.]